MIVNMNLRILLSVTLIALLFGCAEQTAEDRGEVIIVSSAKEPTIEPEVSEPVRQPAPRAPALPKEPELRMDFIDAGTAEVTFIRTEDGKSLLINCGGLQTVERVLAFLSSEAIDTIDALLTTSTDPANIGGCATIKGTVAMDQVLDGLNAAAAKEHKAPYALKDGAVQLMLSTTVAITLQTPYTPDEIRRGNQALTIQVRYGDTDVLLLGDCDLACQRKLTFSAAEVLQLADHGTIEGNGDKLLDVVKPKIAIATAEFNNPQHLPHRELIQKLNLRQIELYRTDLQHTVTLRSDGKGIRMDAEVPYKIERV